MGAVSSRADDDSSAIYLRDQNRFSITSLAITTKGRRVLQVTPNAFPATSLIAKRGIGDDRPIEFVQDPETSSSTLPIFLLRISNEEDLNFEFSIVIRQGQNSTATGPHQPAQDSVINGLTFIFASNNKDLDTLVTREFHADPNLHKNSNVELVGSEFSTGGSPSVQLRYTWKWRPPKQQEDRGGGWRNACTFVEYDSRAHRLNTLAKFSFWVQETKNLKILQLPSPKYDLLVPPRIRVASSHSVQSVMSDSEGPSEKEVPSPTPEPETGQPISQTTTHTVIDVACQRPGEDLSAVDDGPLFRATMKALEQKTGSMRARMKKVLKKAEAAQSAQSQCNDAMKQFTEALREASISNANAIQPALEHYFEKIARQILVYENQNSTNLQKLIIDPMSKLYHLDIKQAEAKKRDFEDESKEYYSYVGRYLGQRQDSLKEKKRIESDSKYQTKRRNFELKRFDYSSFMQDLHGGRKEQEVLSHLTKFADTQTKSYLATARKIEEMLPQLDALIREVSEADKEYQIQRTEREEKRRNLEKSIKAYVESEATVTGGGPSTASAPGASFTTSPDTDLNRADSSGRSTLHHSNSAASQSGTVPNGLTPSSSLRSAGGSPINSPGQDRFRGIRDLEDKNQSLFVNGEQILGPQRKEGLLWALSRPGSHVDPRGLNKQAWHKFWIVLDQGKLSEYSNWKERLDLHMDPIDLRLASVREARNSERRFCFEVITPNFKRVYQATSEEDMANWINAINNALQSAFEGRPQPQAFENSLVAGTSLKRDIGSVLTGKISHPKDLPGSSQSSGFNPGNASSVNRRTTVSARPSYVRTDSGSYGEDPTKLLQEIRDRDQGNIWCADCGSSVKTEWVSINLGIILCIECSGIHRSLGTHVSKIRSLTLDIVSFTSDIVEIIMLIGNRISNQIWEAKLDQALKPSPTANRDQRLKFITEKYVDRTYVNSISSTLSHYATSDETLVASVKRNDIEQVLYALALRANPNATDKFRNTHVVFLALAAADPASPNAATTSSMPDSPRSAGSQQAKRLSAFPVAELLLQNGGDLPSTMPPFPLSQNAQQYLEQRSLRASGDTLGALPNIKSPGTASDKDRERLHKRTSAGAKFGGRTLGL